MKMKVYYSVGVVGKKTVSPHQYYRLMLPLLHKLILTAQTAACSEQAHKPIYGHVSFWPSIQLLIESTLR